MEDRHCKLFPSHPSVFLGWKPGLSSPLRHPANKTVNNSAPSGWISSNKISAYSTQWCQHIPHVLIFAAHQKGLEPQSKGDEINKWIVNTFKIQVSKLCTDLVQAYQQACKNNDLFISYISRSTTLISIIFVCCCFVFYLSFLVLISGPDG